MTHKNTTTAPRRRRPLQPVISDNIILYINVKLCNKISRGGTVQPHKWST